MKDKKYEIIEKRTIVIKDGSKVFKTEIPLDFVVTEEWIEDKMSDPRLKRCEDWLILKGFVKNGDRWEYLHKKKIYLKLPLFFKDWKNYRLMVKFGYVNASSFIFPEIGMGYRTLEDLPWELPEKCYIEIHRPYTPNTSNWNCLFSFQIYEKFMTTNFDETIDDSYYFGEILKTIKENKYDNKDEIDKMKRFIQHNLSYLETNDDYLNLTKSLFSIEKFNL